METRQKREVIQEIEKSRRALPMAWQIVRIRNPVTAAAQATTATIHRWKNQADEGSRKADLRLRISPYRYIGLALVVGAATAWLVRTLRSR
jgi:hypothetical protein